MPEQNQVCFTTLGIEKDRWTLDNYRSVGGYEAWQKILDGELDRAAVIEEVKAFRAARPRRRGISDGAQVELHAQGRRPPEISRM